MLWARPSFAEKTHYDYMAANYQSLSGGCFANASPLSSFVSCGSELATEYQRIEEENSYLYSFCDKKDAVEISALDLFTDDPDLRDMNEHLIVQEQAGLLSSTFNESSELSPHVSPNISACSDDIGERLVFCLLFFNYYWFRIFMNEGLQALHKTQVRSGEVTFGELLCNWRIKNGNFDAYKWVTKDLIKI